MSYATSLFAARLALAVTLALGACAPAATSPATGPRPVDVAAVRREIKGSMAHDWTAAGRFHGERTIVSMGHVTHESAVVYTDAEGKRYAETWVRDGGGWELKDVQPAG